MFQNLALTGLYVSESGLDWLICSKFGPGQSRTTMRGSVTPRATFPDVLSKEITHLKVFKKMAEAKTRVGP